MLLGQQHVGFKTIINQYSPPTFRLGLFSKVLQILSKCRPRHLFNPLNSRNKKGASQTAQQCARTALQKNYLLTAFYLKSLIAYHRWIQNTSA
ncbi:hypothetical protein YSA_01982 [Pseudomonas putida ND6]|uniref:Uncharacterized protein n=1 Tax=Pseudomonas putida ND6 TaxID=231023 RepID=I3UQS1_PSEPU|nr:hypothetical protein YSA_01982 [Pseudomonas putida ND6]